MNCLLVLIDGSPVGTILGDKVGPGVVLLGLKEGSVVGSQVGESVVLTDGSTVGPRLGSEVGGSVPSQQFKI